MINLNDTNKIQQNQYKDKAESVDYFLYVKYLTFHFYLAAKEIL